MGYIIFFFLPKKMYSQMLIHTQMQNRTIPIMSYYNILTSNQYLKYTLLFIYMFIISFACLNIWKKIFFINYD